MTTKVVTTFNNRLYKEYAHRFWDTFPHDKLDLTVYSEEPLEIPHKHLYYQDEFVARNGHKRTRDYKHDAVRFCYKPYAIAQCLEHECRDDRYDRILWIDADTVFFRGLSESWIDENLYNSHTVMTYMGRHNYYSETGLLLFNLTHKETRRYIHTVREYYDSNTVYLLEEQHDSYIWDYVRTQFESQGYKFNDVGITTHKVPGGHIQAQQFGSVMDHTKGKRKVKGYSSENRYRRI